MPRISNAKNRLIRRVLALAGLTLLVPMAGRAHEAGGGFILLMPTEVYILGASLAVLASFLVLAVVPAERFHAVYRGEAGELPSGALHPSTTVVSCLSFLFVLFLLYAGVEGPTDPLSNPITLGVWTLGWIILSALTALVGNLWPWLNPWTGPLRLMGLGRSPFLKLPEWLGSWIAVAQIFYLIWIDLISIHSFDPESLTVHLGLYFVLNALGMIVFGMADWTRRAEPLHFLFDALATVSPIQRNATGKLHLVLPGAAALARPAMSLSAAGFVILMLASGTFDGVASTFKWLAVVGQNPLDFVGRSAVIWQNTSALVAGTFLLTLIFASALWLGERIAGTRVPLRRLVGRFAYTLLPIYVAYMLSHFAVRLIMDAQYLLRVISDPLSLGWNLFGTADHHVTRSMLATEAGVHMIWTFQTAVITLGHIVAVLMAHGVSLDTHDTPKQAIVSQIPLALFMVFYTSLGLWLLAQPRI